MATGISMGSHRFFYGWWLVFVCLLLLSVGTGTSIYLYSVIAGELDETFASARYLIMAGATVFFLCAGFISPKVGQLIDRYPLKWIAAIGGAVMGAGFILVSVSTHIWQVIVCYAIFIGIGMATLSSLLTFTLINRWFVQHRGLAVGIASLGTQFGGFVYPPMMVYLMDIYEWRVALGMLGGAIAVFIPLLSLLCIKDYPEQMGLLPDGGTETETSPLTTEIKHPPVKLSFWQFCQQRNFILVAIGISCASAVNTAVITNLSLFTKALGEGAERGAYLISLMSLMGMISSPLLGRFCDLWNIRLISGCIFLLGSGSSFIFFLSNDYPMMGSWGFSVLKRHNPLQPPWLLASSGVLTSS